VKLFIDRLIDSINEKQNPSVIGLDPRLEMIPEEIRNRHLLGKELTSEMASRAIIEFNKKVIDIIAPVVPAVKPQIAFYEMFGPSGLKAYFETIEYAQRKDLLVIGDIKRGDIGTTAEAYALGHLITKNVCGVMTGGCSEADAITLNPYLGTDSARPFLRACKQRGSGIFVLVKTSNPSSAEIQNLDCEGITLYMKVAQLVNNWGNDLRGRRGYSSVAAVVGATYPEVIKEIREEFPGLFLLIPGYGAQGGDAEMVRSAFDDHGNGAIVNSSRGIIFAWQKSSLPWEKAVYNATVEMREILNALRRN